LVGAGFEARIERPNVYQIVTAGVARQIAGEEERCPQLVALADGEYAAGLEALKEAVDQEAKDGLLEAEFCLIEVAAARRRKRPSKMCCWVLMLYTDCSMMGLALRFEHPRNGLQTHAVAQIYLRRERRGSTRNVEYQPAQRICLGWFPCTEGHNTPNPFVSTARLVLNPISPCLDVQIDVPGSSHQEGTTVFTPNR
jgi:hypothetical protein